VRERQNAIAAEQRAMGTREAELGHRQAELGRRQRIAAEEAAQRIQRIIEKAVAAGDVQPVK